MVTRRGVRRHREWGHGFPAAVESTFDRCSPPPSRRDLCLGARPLGSIPSAPCHYPRPTPTARRGIRQSARRTRSEHRGRTAPDRRSLRARGIRARPTAGTCDVRLAASARAEGKQLGRQPYLIEDGQLANVDGLSVRDAAKVLGVSYSVIHRRRLSRKPRLSERSFAPETGADPAASESRDVVA